MAAVESIVEHLSRDLPGAKVEAQDTTGTGDHFAVEVVWDGFAGLTQVNQHRKVYESLSQMLDDGSIHALQIKTEVYDDGNK